MCTRVLPLVTIALGSACHIEPCDPGQRHVHGVCFDVPTDASPDATTDASTDAGPDASCGDDPYSGFGDPCFDSETHEDCTCAADTCALQPPIITDGFCTRLHCLEDESICPPGWECVDLSAIEPKVGSVCVESS